MTNGSRYSHNLVLFKGVFDMLISVIISIITLFIALGGVVFSLKKNPNAKASWANMTWYGKIVPFALILLTLGSIYTSREVKLDAETLNSQITDLDEQLKIERSEQAKVRNVVRNIKNESAQSIILLSSMSELITQHVKPEPTDKATSPPKDSVTTLLEYSNYNIAYNRLEILKDCDLNSDGEFYWELFIDGELFDRLEPSEAIRVGDNQSIPIKASPVVAMLSSNQSVSFSGYVREQDGKTFFTKRWKYKYNGFFDESINVANNQQGKIAINSSNDCKLLLHLSIDKQ